jgi:hypothetical protein
LYDAASPVIVSCRRRARAVSAAASAAVLGFLMGGLGSSTLWDALWGTYCICAAFFTLVLRSFALRHAGDAYLVFEVDSEGAAAGGGDGEDGEPSPAPPRHRRSARVGPETATGEERPLTAAASGDTSEEEGDDDAVIHVRS